MLQTIQLDIGPYEFDKIQEAFAECQHNHINLYYTSQIYKPAGQDALCQNYQIVFRFPKETKRTIIFEFMIQWNCNDRTKDLEPKLILLGRKELFFRKELTKALKVSSLLTQDSDTSGLILDGLKIEYEIGTEHYTIVIPNNLS